MPPNTASVTSAAQPARSLGSHRAVAAKTNTAMLRGGAAVGATAVLGAVVTSGLMAVDPKATQHAAADAAELSAMDLANASQALATPVPKTRMFHGVSSARGGPTSTSMLPVAAPADDKVSAAADKRDVDMLHKAERLADEAAAVHAAMSREAMILRGGGRLDDWIRVALSKMNMSQSLAPGIRAVIMKESRGNPNAVNRTDSNALAGRPSQGLMQCIPSTFRAYVLPELAHLGITNPVANITAGVRYMVSTYGLGTLIQGGRIDSAGRYLGY